MTEDETVGWHHRLNGHEFEQAPGVADGQGSLVCCTPAPSETVRFSIISSVPVLSSSLHPWQSVVFMLTLLKGNFNSFSDYYLVIYTEKTV